MAKARKGSIFERWVATQLSLWWTEGASDQVFWRTSNSGGRATTRNKAGKQANLHCGDLCALDAIGQPLLDLLTIEIKRGYSKWTLADLLDTPMDGPRPRYQEWIEQVQRAQQQAGVWSWLLIVKRDRRVPLVLLPQTLELELVEYGAVFDQPVSPAFTIWYADKKDNLCGFTLTSFLEAVSPTIIRRLARRYMVRSHKKRL